MQRIPRGENLAILNKENQVRVLLNSTPTKAAELARALAKNSPGLSPYRVAVVEVVEVMP
jgi:hypothetical protein